MIGRNERMGGREGNKWGAVVFKYSRRVVAIIWIASSLTRSLTRRGQRFMEWAPWSHFSSDNPDGDLGEVSRVYAVCNPLIPLHILLKQHRSKSQSVTIMINSCHSDFCLYRITDTWQMFHPSHCLVAAHWLMYRFGWSVIFRHWTET